MKPNFCNELTYWVCNGPKRKPGPRVLPIVTIILLPGLRLNVKKKILFHQESRVLPFQNRFYSEKNNYNVFVRRILPFQNKIYSEWQNCSNKMIIIILQFKSTWGVLSLKSARNIDMQCSAHKRRYDQQCPQSTRFALRTCALCCTRYIGRHK